MTVLAGEFDQPTHINMFFHMGGEQVQRRLDLGAVRPLRGRDAQIAQKGRAEMVIREHAVQIAAHHPTIRRDGTLSTALNLGKGLAAIGACRATNVDFIG